MNEARRAAERRRGMARIGGATPTTTPSGSAGAVVRAMRTFNARVEDIATWDIRREGAWARSLARALQDTRNELVRDSKVSRRVRERAEALMRQIVAKQRGLESVWRQKGLPANSLSNVRLESEQLATEWQRWRKRAAETPLEVSAALPEVAIKEAAWSRAASSPVLPNRFVVATVSGDRVSHVVVGRPVPPALKLGLDPDPAAAGAETFSLDAHGDLVLGASIRWMIDYSEALARGMAISVPITPAEAGAGFDRVYVLGLCSGDELDGEQRVSALLDNHHYGQTGLAL
jgi:hypothetical protein